MIILDEPTSGLDPKQIIEVRELIKQLAGEQTVILSTHILPEATMICSRVVIIDEGQIVAEDSIDNLVTGTTDNIAHLMENERFLFIQHDVTNYIYIEGTGHGPESGNSPASEFNELGR